MRCVTAFLAALLVFSATAAGTPPTGELIEGIKCRSDPSQSYTLYLPSAYDSERQWPVLLVFDPRGRSLLAAELFREAAEDYGWILVSSNDTRSDQSMEPNRRAVNALWPEIHDRYSIDERRIYAAGFSGTASVALLMAHETGGLAGVIVAGGRFVPDAVQGARFSVFGAVGDTDFNFREMSTLHELLAEQGSRQRLEVFEGPHGWMPPALAGQAVVWLELDAMRRGHRPKEPGLVAGHYADDVAAAERLESSGRELAAMRRYQAIVATLEGLHEVDEPARRAQRLAGTAEVKRQLKDEKRWNGFEARFLEQRQQVWGALLAGESAPTERRLARDLELEELQQRSEAPGWQGVTARRLLQALYTESSFYLYRDLLGQGRFDHAAAVLGVAARIHDDRPVLWYNRACALARAGRRDDALDSLERAVDAGYADLDHMKRDSDLDSLRDSESYQSLEARLGEPARN